MARGSKPVRGVYVLPAIFIPVFVLLWATMGFEEGARATGTLLLAAVVLVPGVIAAILIPVAIHELGHLWAGLRTGYHFESIRVGPFRWDSRGLRTNWAVEPPLGLCEMHPPLGMASWREALLFVSGGPLANLAGASLAAIAFALAGGRTEMMRPFSSVGAASIVQLVFLLLFGGNAAGLVFSLVPVRSGDVRSDGLQLLDLWRHRTR